MLLHELRAMLTKPCFAWMTPVYQLPRLTTAVVLRTAAADDRWLAPVLQGIEVVAGKRYIHVPAALPRALTEAARVKLAPVLCRANDPGCARSESYVQRAERAFAEGRGLREESARLARYLDPPCDASGLFSPWLACATAELAVAALFSREVTYAAPDQGWLILRGRRGYDGARELRAYDLATGAAYVASTSQTLGQPPGALTPGGYGAAAGHVARDLVREIAFLLLARPGIIPVRNEAHALEIPEVIQVAVTPTRSLTPEIASSIPAHSTHVAFTWVHGAQRADGTFAWLAISAVDDHIQELVELMEVGFVRTCAPAALPPLRVLQSTIGGAMRADNDVPAARHSDLTQALETLRGQACKP